MSNAAAGATIDPAPTHADLAARIGTHREAITREISHLIGEGILEQHQRRLTILDMEKLANLVQAATGFDIEMLQRGASGRPA
jgi:DNA-binding GntR family transcriptional regulator